MEFRPGDLIEAKKGDTVIRGRLTDMLEVTDSGWLVDSLVDECFDVQLMDRPKPDLPTVPGFYVRKPSGNETLTGYAVAVLYSDGEWAIDNRNYGGSNPRELVASWNQKYGLIRLVPEQ